MIRKRIRTFFKTSHTTCYALLTRFANFFVMLSFSCVACYVIPTAMKNAHMNLKLQFV